MNWKAVLLKRALVAHLPLANELRKLKRQLFGYPPNPAFIDSTIKNYGRLKNMLGATGFALRDSVVLEIGSGWFPVIPILMLRDGAAKVALSDLNPHMDSVIFRETATCLKQRFPDDEFIQELSSIDGLALEYLAPFDPNSIQDESFDLVYSHQVLEHIMPEALYRLFTSIRPKIKANGCMAHIIDNTDHFWHFDKDISRVEFLRWSNQKHALINILLKGGENRLRHGEYGKLFEDCGYQIDKENSFIETETLEQLPQMELAYPFSVIDAEELARLDSLYIASPRPAP